MVWSFHCKLLLETFKGEVMGHPWLQIGGSAAAGGENAAVVLARAAAHGAWWQSSYNNATSSTTSSSSLGTSPTDGVHHHHFAANVELSSSSSSATAACHHGPKWACSTSSTSQGAMVMLSVDRFLLWVPIKKTTQGRPNECQVVHLGITIKLIDRSQGD